MEWWQYLLISVVSAAVGACIAYLFNRLGATRERIVIDKKQFQTAIAAILGEVQANENIAKKPWTGKQLPFLADCWIVYKRQLSDVPQQVVQKIDEFYLDVVLANAIVSQDLHKLPWGSGYLDNQYQDICKNIREKSPQLVKELISYLE